MDLDTCFLEDKPTVSSDDSFLEDKLIVSSDDSFSGCEEKLEMGKGQSSKCDDY